MATTTSRQSKIPTFQSFSQDVTANARARAGAPLPRFQEKSEENKFPSGNPNTGYNVSRSPSSSGGDVPTRIPPPQPGMANRGMRSPIGSRPAFSNPAIALPNLPDNRVGGELIDRSGQHVALGRYRPPMFDLEGNFLHNDAIGGYSYNLPNAFGPYPLYNVQGRYDARDIAGMTPLANPSFGQSPLMAYLLQSLMTPTTTGGVMFATPAKPPAPAGPPAAPVGGPESPTIPDPGLPATPVAPPPTGGPPSGPAGAAGRVGGRWAPWMPWMPMF